MTIKNKTESGAQKVHRRKNPALNAIKHGGYAKTKVLFCESQRKYERFARNYRVSCDPQDPIEHDLVETLIHLSWVNQRLLNGIHWQEEILKEKLDPKQCAAHLGLNKLAQKHLPPYLLDFEHNFSLDEVKAAKKIWDQSQTFIKLLPGLLDMTLMKPAHEEFLAALSQWLRKQGLYGWQSEDRPSELAKLWIDRKPLLIEEIEQMCAPIYFQAHWPQLKPKIERWLEYKFYVLRYDTPGQGDIIAIHRDIGKRQDALFRQRQGYAHALGLFMKYRKSRQAVNHDDPTKQYGSLSN